MADTKVFLSGNRIQGRSDDSISSNATLTYTGDMSSNWNQTDSGADFTIDTTNEEVDLLGAYNANNVHWDSSTVATLSTTAWVVRFAYQNTGTASSDNPVWWVGFSSTAVNASNSTAADFVGFGTQVGNGTTNMYPYIYATDGGRLDQANATGIGARLQLDSSNVDLVSNNTKYYIEIKRDVNDFTVNVYSDSAYSTLLCTKTYTDATIAGLRYFIIANYIQGASVTGTFSEFNWWNGVTSPVTVTPKDKSSFVTAAVPASTGWTFDAPFTLTSGTGIIVSASSSQQNTAAVYDLGTSGQLTPDDDWVCDYTLTRNSGDVFDHPMLMFKSKNTGYGTGVPNNGDNQILFQYWANGGNSDQSGSNVMNTRFRAGGTEYETGAQVSVGSNNANIPAIGTTLYYRVSMTARVHTISAWTSDAYRTSGGSTGRVIHNADSTALNSGWDQSDPLRYVMVIHRNNNAGEWTISDFKFWNATTSTSGTPNVAFTFIDQKKVKSENKIQVEINGDLFNCSIIKEPLYDPSGQKMRS